MTVTATIYILDEGGLRMDCDICHTSLLDGSCVAIGSTWVADAVECHRPLCPGPVVP